MQWKIWPFAMNFIKALSVTDAFNDATVWSSCKNLVGFEPDWDLFYFEYLIYLWYQLYCKLLLSYVVFCLNNNPHQLPRLEISIRRIRSYSLFLFFWSFFWLNLTFWICIHRWNGPINLRVAISGFKRLNRIH